MPKFDYSDDIILHFEDMKGINLNEDVQKFVKSILVIVNKMLNILTIK